MVYKLSKEKCEKDYIYGVFSHEIRNRGWENEEEIEIEEGTERIGDCVFSMCEKLKHVIIPESVKEIGGCAFCGCHSLTELILPNYLVKIGPSALTCIDISDIKLPRTVKEIDSDAFAASPNLVLHIDKSQENLIKQFNCHYLID